nr:retrovirus-related Pol polyprotein from transposon TNT 1-94 [Tanacetum cinerariifolium]
MEQCSVDRKCCEIQQKQVLIENDRLLDKIISQDIVNLVLNLSVVICESVNENDESVDTCKKCLELEAEFLKKNDVYIKLLKWFSNLEQHCIYLEVSMQLNQEIFQKDKSCDTQTLKNELRKLKGKNVIDTAVSKPKAITVAPGMLKITVVPLPPKLFKNKDAHIEYIQKFSKHADVLWEIVKDVRTLSPLDSNVDSACKHAQRIQEVLVYVHVSCPCLTTPSAKLIAFTPINKDKKVRFAEPSSNNTQKQVDSHTPKDSNKPLLYSTGVICAPSASGSKPTGNTKNNMISQPSSSNKTNKSLLNTNSNFVCGICNECLFDANHNKCVLDYVHDVNVVSNSKPAKCKNKKQIWKPTSKVYTEIGLKWKPTRLTFTIVGHKFPLTRFASPKVVPLKESDIKLVPTLTPRIKVYYVEGHGHNLFSVGKFCYSDLEVDFCKHTCFVRNLEGVDLLSISWGTNLYTLSIGDMMKSSPICLLSKASKTSSWLWHRRLSHLNFGTLNQPAKQGLVRGLPKLKFEKDHLCSACSLGKRKKQSPKPKSKDTNQEKLYLLHMDLCGPMRVQSINGKKDDSVLRTLRFVSKSEEYQVYGALLPKRMNNQKMRDSTAYKTYLAFATGAATPKKARKFKKPSSPLKKKDLRPPDVFVSKKEAPAKAKRSKGIELLSKATLLEKAYDDEEEKDDEYLHTPKNNVPTDDETDVEMNNEDKGEMTHVETVNTEHEEVNQEVAGEPEIISMMDVKVQHEDTSTKSSPLLTIPISIIPEQTIFNPSNIVSTAPAPTISLILSSLYLALQQITPIPTPTTTKATTTTTAIPDSDTLSAIHQRLSNLEKEVNILKEVDHKSEILQQSSLKNAKHKALYHALMESILEDEDAMDKGVADKSKKRKPYDADRDEGPPPKSTSKSAQAEEILFEARDTQGPQNLREDTWNTDEPPVVIINPKDWFNKLKRQPTLDPEWNEGNSQIVSVDYFFNNDLAYLQGGSTRRTYMTYLTKTKVAKYDLPRIKDMVPNLWSPVKVAYDKHALLGTSY